jgi:hypothetical protein
MTSVFFCIHQTSGRGKGSFVFRDAGHLRPRRKMLLHFRRRRSPFRTEQASFFGMLANDAPAENCSCIFGVPAGDYKCSRLRFSGCWRSMHPPENAPAFPFPAYPQCVSNARYSVFQDAAVDARAENCSCIFGVHALSQTLQVSFFGMPPLMHPPENAPAFPACPPSMAAKKKGALSAP